MYSLPTILPWSGRYSGMRVHKFLQISITIRYGISLRDSTIAATAVFIVDPFHNPHHICGGKFQNWHFEQVGVGKLTENNLTNEKLKSELNPTDASRDEKRFNQNMHWNAYFVKCMFGVGCLKRVMPSRSAVWCKDCQSKMVLVS
jgi:hypothetical protein